MSTFFDPKDKSSKPILDFFEDKSWLIIDNSRSTRTSLKKTIVQLGSKLSNMHDADNFTDAKKLIETHKPQFIIGNNKITGGSTISLFATHLKALPNRMNSGFFVIAEASSLEEVALALEYEMDGIISAPFTGVTIIDTLIRGVKYKISPNAYSQKIEEGREKYIHGELDEAKDSFQTSLSLHGRPYEGHYFLGRISNDRQLLEEAIASYEEAVHQNPEYYRALKDLCSLYYKKKDFIKAYNTNLLMTAKYPTAPDKVPELIRLSIINKKYEDISNYYKVFCTIQSPSPEMQLSLSAGLAILGKYFLNNKDSEKGTDALKGAFKFSNGKFEILKSITNTFEQYDNLQILLDLFDQADIDAWPVETQGFYFHTLHLISNEDSRVVMDGEKLLKKKVRNILVYKGLIERGIKMKRKLNYFEKIVLEGTQNLPEYKDELEDLLQKVREKSELL
jgi:tetratricopeptide (TPR) repeat protein